MAADVRRIYNVCHPRWPKKRPRWYEAKALRHQSGEDIKFFSTVEDVYRWLGLE